MRQTLAPELFLTVMRENGMGCNSYLIESADAAFLVDPAQALPAGINIALTGILATHAHYDHVRLLNTLRSGGVPVHLHTDEQQVLTDPQYNLSPMFGDSTAYPAAERTLKDGSEIQLSAAYGIRLYHTPGHTPGCCCYLIFRNDDNVPVALFSGDTLFMDSIGRTDFPGGSPAAMRRSLNRLNELAAHWPDDLPVFAGHGPSTTIGRERRFNPWLNT